MKNWWCGKESIRLALPEGSGPESLEGWSGEIHKQQSRLLTFWDTFEWGLWFAELLLYRCDSAWSLCTRDGGWPGEVLCTEAAVGAQRFWQDFQTPAMRSKLKEALELRALSAVATGTFQRCIQDLRSETGKVICRLEWISVTAGTQHDNMLHQACRVFPLPDCESDAADVVAHLIRIGATNDGDGPLDRLLQHGGQVPRKYTLRPDFGLKWETPAREAVARIVRTMLGIAGETMPGIISDLDTEFLHDYRICLRKIRSLLSLIKNVNPPEEIGPIRTTLGDLARETNRLRDLDVYLLRREEYRELLPPELRVSLEEIFKDFAAQREDELQRVIVRLREPTQFNLLREVMEYFAEDARHGASSAAELPVGPLVFRRIRKRYRKIRGIARVLGADTPDESIHRLRIECKKLRYLMEFFGELIHQEDGASLVKLLKRLQGRIGDFNDASVQRNYLLSYGAGHRAGSVIASALGNLVDLLDRRQQEARVLIHQALDEFCRDETVAAIKRLCTASHHPR